MKRYAILLFTLFLTQALFAGDEQKFHLTGVPQVDFFSLRDFPTREYTPQPLALFSQEESSVEGEKSPWLAAGLSLLLPGAGEFYAGNYIKSGIFLGIEAGLWTTAAIYDKKGDDQTKLFEDYANAHWSAVRYAVWVRDHISDLNSNATWDPNVFKDGFDPDDPEQHCDPPFPCMDWIVLQSVERDIAQGGGSGFTHVLPFYGQQQYYELIGKYEQFSRGWDDSDPNLEPGNTYPIKSTSKRFFEYAEMRAEANNFYDVSSAMVNIVVLNHVLSAIDAAWTASQHNKELHAEARLRMQPTPFGTAPVQEINVTIGF